MLFVFDPKKNATNIEKHGMSFLEAQALWKDDDAIRLPAKDRGEPRYLVVGMISGKHWTAIATNRGDAVRIISVRRSHEEEVRLYERRKR
ncbi:MULTISPECIES: BrnT family toxin [unclassified Adlercreutzia]|uniref:BrnT family toxin n=1 Tax=unclassified Adlercreutzia TaxID=2636013 RepID=UPI0019822276|nr:MULTISPECIES: BrnT family toxin [unclassified Adlercreutzia]